MLSELWDYLKDYVKEGEYPMGIDHRIDMWIESKGLKALTKGYKGFPTASCISVNRVAAHGIPTSRALNKGDIVKIDVMIEDEEGQIEDGCYTYLIPGPNTIKKRRLIKVAYEAMCVGINEAKEGVPVNKIGGAIHQYVLSQGFDVLKELWSHGVGRDGNAHVDPVIPSFYHPDYNYVLKKGDRITIEPVIVEYSDYKIKIMNDGWSVYCNCDNAQFERTIDV